MLYKVMVMLHMLGASVWIGGHAVLVLMVLPHAVRENQPARVIQFERGFGRLGLVALIMQLVTGLWLAKRWIGEWSMLFRAPTPQTHLIFSKLVVLILTIAIAGYTYHRVLPRLSERGLTLFALLSSTTTVLAIFMLILGVGIRTGGLI